MIDALRRFTPTFLQQHATSASTRSTLGRLLACRTPALGGHRYDCENCGYSAVLYNSCGDRHCPQCQGPRRHRWVDAQQRLLLPVPHFQVVFTLPAELRAIAKAFPRQVYDTLFQASQLTLQKLAATHWEASTAILAVLHTWSRELTFHPHVHCLVSAGGLTCDGGWVGVRSDFLFHTMPLRRLFRGIFLSRLTDLGLDLDRGQRLHLRNARRRAATKDWHVYVEPPNGRDPQHVVKYLARYVYQTAISDHRIVSVSDTAVTFRTRGSATLTLPGSEFVRRYTNHFTPKGFRKVRHYGLLAPGARARLELARDIAEHVSTASASPADPPAEPVLADSALLSRAHRCPTCADPLRITPIHPDRTPIRCARDPP